MFGWGENGKKYICWINKYFSGLASLCRQAVLTGFNRVKNRLA